MPRFRNYGQARGTSSYLSRLDEYSLNPQQKHEAYLRRKAAAEASVTKFAIGAPKPVGPIWDGPVDYEAMLVASQAAEAAAAAAAGANQGPASPTISAIDGAGTGAQRQIPQAPDLLAGIDEEDEEELGEAPVP